jgi:Ca2+-binding RTX toxin-like protein
LPKNFASRREPARVRINARGGNDTLSIASTTDKLFGDAQELHGFVKAGNDILISGAANDQMWGDAAVLDVTVDVARDIFVLAR